MLIQTPFFNMLCFNKVLALGFLKAYSNKVGATKKIKADPKRGFFYFTSLRVSNLKVCMFTWFFKERLAGLLQQNDPMGYLLQ